MDDTLPAPADITAAVAEFASVLGNDGNLDVDCPSTSPSAALFGTTVPSRSSRGTPSWPVFQQRLIGHPAHHIGGCDHQYDAWLCAHLCAPWVTDEIATFDGPNLRALMQMLAENRIDVITAAPDLDPLLHPLFAQPYLFQDRGRIRERHVAPDQSTQALEGARHEQVSSHSVASGRVHLPVPLPQRV